ncbi:alpha/beta fold hydrolase [Altererythrobacter salegens]|uniref:Alpha/beta fold hydrolase n=1 Tax=Croceibacterium salegens TaxID=1737568 RepID=A0A6I4SZE7_9SPHN|nr:alpha/beta hydrolase [Croceibacterium salegens]MXO60407.1 alpha/beta fold hydrolase [Croceibacterium salegens]
MALLRSLAAASMALSLLFAGTTAAAQDAPQIVGDWHGSLVTPRGPVVLVLYVTEGADGALEAKIENANQAPGQFAEVTSISVTGEHLSWTIDRIGASFEGDWQAAEHTWKGTFNQGADLPLTFEAGQPPAKPVVEGLDGRWEGTAKLNNATLRQVLRIETGDRGTIMLVDSPDQLANGVPVESFERDGQDVSFSLMGGMTKFAGKLSDDMTRLDGTYTTSVNGNVAEVHLERKTGEAAASKPPSRPQTPKEPFPYTAEEVAFDNPAFPEVHLAATLTLPEGKGPFPAAVMITGSGGQDRDEALMGHRPFAVIADYLTRRGIAVLRYDDRGIAKSTGTYANATSADLATDANAAAAYLMTRPEIRHDAIGFVGHSEGGMIGPIAASQNPAIGFVVLLAGPGTHLDQLMLSQQRLLGMTMGASEAQIDRQEPIMAAVFKAIIEADTPEDGKVAARAVLTPEAMATIGVPAGTDPDLIVGQVSGPWYQYFLKYDPAPVLASLTMPILAIGGSLDLQVPAEDNLAAIKAATAGNPDATTVELPGLNHLFQHATTGGVGEYAQIEETFAPEALKLVGDWIARRFVK